MAILTDTLVNGNLTINGKIQGNTPTATAGTSTEQIASTEFVTTAIASSGSALETAINSKVTANAAITNATKCKITYDTKGLVTAGANLAASDIPELAASKITSGTFADARIASASTWNAKQNALTFDTTPTENSSNPVTSAGVKSYVDSKAGKANCVADYGNTSASVYAGWSGSGITTASPDYDSSEATTSGHLAAYCLRDGKRVIKDVKCANVTVGNAQKVNGHPISVMDDEGCTIYFA